jgi:hypothetical protein
MLEGRFLCQAGERLCVWGRFRVKGIRCIYHADPSADSQILKDNGMIRTKYDELMSASEKRRELYENYESECQAFIGQLRSSLVDFLGCSEEQVRWLRFAEEETAGLTT